MSDVIKPEPCRCPAPNPECRRAGAPTVGRLWELCSNNCPAERPCPDGLSEQYRALWDGLGGAPPPTLLQKAGRFIRAAARHVADGLRKVPEDTYAEREALCRACPFFIAAHAGGSCAKCGCRVGTAWLDKLRWRTSACPIGKWGPAPEEGSDARGN